MSKDLSRYLSDFEHKNLVLRGLYSEVTPSTFYEYLFSDLDIFSDTCVVTYGSDQKLSVSHHNPLQSTIRVMTVADAIESSIPYANMYLAPATFFKGRNSVGCLKKLYAIVVDFDGDAEGVSDALLRWLIDRISVNSSDLPAPTFVTNSGRGLHLFWVFEKPIPMFAKNKVILKKLYLNIHQTLIDSHATPQRHHFAQAYRIVGSRTKFDQVTTAFKTGNTYPVEMLLSDFGLGDELILWEEGKSRVNLAPTDAMMHFTECIEKTLHISCSNKNSWQVVYKFINDNKQNFYDAVKEKKLKASNNSGKKKKTYVERTDGKGIGSVNWYLNIKQRIIDETPEGNRYTSLMAFMVIGYKCNIPFDQVKEDEYDIILKWQMRPKSFKVRFTDDYKDRVDDLYSEKYLTVTNKQLEDWLGFKNYSSIRRNHQTREDHLEEARAIRDIRMRRKGKKWDEDNGKQSREKIVSEWQKNHPNGRKVDCINDTGLSKPTVYKWWKSS